MDPSNVGDLYSTPLKYYKFSISTEENNIASNEWDVVSLGYFKAIILGGGGMFHFQNKIQNIIQEYPGGLIGCGRINLGIIK